MEAGARRGRGGSAEAKRGASIKRSVVIESQSVTELQTLGPAGSDILAPEQKTLIEKVTAVNLTCPSELAAAAALCSDEKKNNF